MIRTLEIAALVVTLLFALPVGFATGACAFFGSYCEYAIIGPTERGLLTKNLQELNATDGNGAVLRAEERGSLIGASRLDVYGQQGELTKLIGSSGSVENYAVGTDGTWVLVFASRNLGRYEVELDIELYLLADAFLKRTFTMKCDSYLDRKFRILNPTFSSTANSIEFDVVSDCSQIVVNGILELGFGGKYRSGRALLKLNSEWLVVQTQGAVVSQTQ